MELFNNEGHLTPQGLKALMDETLDEMGRLEAAEHLAFCDACLTQYTSLLTDDVLRAPEKPLAKGILRRIRKKPGRIPFARYGTVAAAAVLTVVMWGVGNFALQDAKPSHSLLNNTPAAANQDAPKPATNKPDPGFGSRFSQAVDDTSNAVNGFLDRYLTVKEDENTEGRNSAAQLQQQKEEARREKEKVFERNIQNDKDK